MSPDAPLFLDLDGVLLDVSERYWRLHCDLLAPYGGARLDKATYWTRRRERQPLATVLHEGVDEDAYRLAWLERIEAPEYLRHDTVVPGARERLVLLGRAHPLVLATLRRRRDHLLAQLETLRLRPLFADVLTARPGDAEVDDAERKARLISTSSLFRRGAIVVGDTEVDVRAGKALGVATVAVLSGIRSRALLLAEGPAAIVDSIASLDEASA